MKSVFYFILAGVLFGLFVYTCTAPEREANENINKALDESQRYTDEVGGLAQQIADICIEYEDEDSVPLDSIYRIAMDIVDKNNGAINILEDASSSMNREVYNNEY